MNGQIGGLIGRGQKVYREVKDDRHAESCMGWAV